LKATIETALRWVDFFFPDIWSERAWGFMPAHLWYKSQRLILLVPVVSSGSDNRPVYLNTHNLNAAISTGASVLRASPYTLTGAGLTIGVCDGGSVRSTHQEFSAGGRIVVEDGSASIDHATHVGGTIAAAGVTASARGMATAVIVDSYDWNSDKSEMTARAATAPQPGWHALPVQSSYGYISGWNYMGGGGSPARLWEWNGNGTNTAAFDYDFGRYNTYSRDSDALAASAPYYLMFRSAGNDRTENPGAGQTVALSPGGSTVVNYDATLHPTGDGAYRGGFETIGFDAVAKKVLTVGSTADAVTAGARDVPKVAISSFSCGARLTTDVSNPMSWPTGRGSIRR
jgi:hypothetical protein